MSEMVVVLVRTSDKSSAAHAKPRRINLAALRANKLVLRRDFISPILFKLIATAAHPPVENGFISYSTHLSISGVQEIMFN